VPTELAMAIQTIAANCRPTHITNGSDVLSAQCSSTCPAMGESQGRPTGPNIRWVSGRWGLLAGTGWRSRVMAASATANKVTAGGLLLIMSHTVGGTRVLLPPLMSTGGSSRTSSRCTTTGMYASLAGSTSKTALVLDLPHGLAQAEPRCDVHEGQHPAKDGSGV
jgi:hypothetical protein